MSEQNVARADVSQESPFQEEEEHTQEAVAQHHLETQQALQGAINRVAQDHLGKPLPEIRAALQRELVAIGRWPQPHGWLESVCCEMADDRVYVVGRPHH